MHAGLICFERIFVLGSVADQLYHLVVPFTGRDWDIHTLTCVETCRVGEVF